MSEPVDKRSPCAETGTPRGILLDLFCGAGGCAKGYQRAGFKVVGVDIKPQPNYCGDQFIQADAMEVLAELDETCGWDAIHASPPCQDHSYLRVVTGRDHGTGWMLDEAVTRLMSIGVPWVVENVEGANMPPTVFSFALCGSMFDLRVRRHRKFASNLLMMPPTCDHRRQRRFGPTVDVTGHGMQGREYNRRKELGLPMDTQQDRRDAMGVDWMTRDELAQAIPPAYTEWVGEQLLTAIDVAA